MNDDAANGSAPLAMDAGTFRALGHRLVDQVAAFLEAVPRGPVNARRIAVGGARRRSISTGRCRSTGTDPGPLLERTARLLFEHSLFNGHPRFFGYITASPAPIGMLGDFLAAAVNPNVGAWTLSPAATEIESQTVRWIAELIGYSRRLRRPARQRRQHGEHRLLPGGARREGRLERARAGRGRRRRPPAARLRARRKRTRGSRRPPT